jgi:3',5'-cyclic AMP phosphodiesterase CpdA
MWKIAVTHFPPYATEDSYPEIRKSWCSLFDKYHVDLVLSGHIHQYFRSYPVNNEKVVSDPKEGTIYISSVTVEPREPEPASEKYNCVYANRGGLYQIISIDHNTLEFTSKCIDETIIDKFQLNK